MFPYSHDGPLPGEHCTCPNCQPPARCGQESPFSTIEYAETILNRLERLENGVQFSPMLIPYISHVAYHRTRGRA